MPCQPGLIEFSISSINCLFWLMSFICPELSGFEVIGVRLLHLCYY
jgi:hypothetical protein